MKTIKVTDEIKSKLDEIRSKHGHDNYSDAIGYLIGYRLPEVTAKVTSKVTEPSVKLPTAETKLRPDGSEVIAFTQLGTPVARKPYDPDAVQGLHRSLAKLKEVFK